MNHAFPKRRRRPPVAPEALVDQLHNDACDWLIPDVLDIVAEYAVPTDIESKEICFYDSPHAGKVWGLGTFRAEFVPRLCEELGCPLKQRLAPHVHFGLFVPGISAHWSACSAGDSPLSFRAPTGDLRDPVTFVTASPSGECAFTMQIPFFRTATRVCVPNCSRELLDWLASAREVLPTTHALFQEVDRATAAKVQKSIETLLAKEQRVAKLAQERFAARQAQPCEYCRRKRRDCLCLVEA
jgi:hypothetical protein